MAGLSLGRARISCRRYSITVLHHSSRRWTRLEWIAPWKCWYVYSTSTQIASVIQYQGRKKRLTSSLCLLIHLWWLKALVDLGVRQNRQFATSFRRSKVIKTFIHRSLEGIAFPAKDVVSVLAESRSIICETVSIRMTCKTSTYGSPMLRTNGWLPSLGHTSLKGRVSQ